MLVQFIQDYLKLSFDDLVEKYSELGVQYPSAEEILNYLKTNNATQLAFDCEPVIDSSRAIYLVRKTVGKPFVLFNLFKGIMVSEAEFDNIDQAIEEKFSRLLGSIRASRRY